MERRRKGGIKIGGRRLYTLCKQCGFNGKEGRGIEIDDEGIRGLSERKRAGDESKKIKDDEIWKEVREVKEGGMEMGRRGGGY